MGQKFECRAICLQRLCISAQESDLLRKGQRPGGSALGSKKPMWSTTAKCSTETTAFPGDYCMFPFSSASKLDRPKVETQSAGKAYFWEPEKTFLPHPGPPLLKTVLI